MANLDCDLVATGSYASACSRKTHPLPLNSAFFDRQSEPHMLIPVATEQDAHSALLCYLDRRTLEVQGIHLALITIGLTMFRGVSGGYIF